GNLGLYGARVVIVVYAYEDGIGAARAVDGHRHGHFVDANVMRAGSWIYGDFGDLASVELGGLIFIYSHLDAGTAVGIGKSINRDRRDGLIGVEDELADGLDKKILRCPIGHDEGSFVAIGPSCLIGPIRLNQKSTGTA